MANKQATGKTAKYGSDLARRTRKAILNALDLLERDGKGMAELLKEEIEKNPYKFMELASKYIPKEIDKTVEHVSSSKQLSDDELRDRIFNALGTLERAGVEGEGEEPIH